MRTRAWLLLIFAIVTLGYRAVGVYMRYVSPDLRSQSPLAVRLAGDRLAIAGVNEQAPCFRGWDEARPEPGDRIVAIYDGRGGGGPVRGLFEYGARLRPVDTEHAWALVVDRPGAGGGETRLTLRMPPAVPLSRSRLETLTAIGFEIYLPLLALAAGLFVGLMRPDDDLAFLAALVFLGFAASFGQQVTQFPAGVREPALGVRELAEHAGPYLILLFFFRFPRPSVLERRHAWFRRAALGLTVVFTAAGLTLAFAVHLSFRAHARILEALGTVGLTDGRFETLATGFGVVLILAALASLALNTFHAEGADDRRRMRLITAGASAGLLPLLVLLANDARGVKTPLWFAVACAPLIGVFPLSFVYAVVRHRVFGIRVILRRGLQYALVSRAVLGIEGLAIFGGLYAAARPFVSRPSALLDQGLASAGTAAATLLLLVGIRRVNRRALPAIDRRFFRDRYDAQRLLTGFSRAVRQLASQPDRLLARATAGICEALHPAEIAIFLLEEIEAGPRRDGGTDAASWTDRRSGCFVLRVHRKDTDSRPATGFAGGRSALSEQLARSTVEEPEVLDLTWGRPLAAAAAAVPLRPEPRRGMKAGGRPEGEPATARVDDRALFHAYHAALVVPLVTCGRAIGFLLLGEKRSEEPYSREDKALLLTVAEQMAIALDYAHLFRQAAGQAALRRELQIAAEVQAQLFPHERPPLDTLRYAGFCRAAGGVGGDLFDFLPLANGRMGIAVADIAGKGLPAALLMASLQALLRSHAPTYADRLDELGHELNRHLHESSDGARYATLFFGVYDDGTRDLTFLNAGHLPPMLQRRPARPSDPAPVVRLEPGGTVLGLFPGQTYRVGRLRLCPGDRLLLFSDGVTEAADPDGEMFGEERLLQILAGSRALSEDDLVRRVLDRVDAHRAGAAQQDDLTVIAACVV